MTCSSCKKEKNQIHAKKSAIIKEVTNFMCQSCIDAGYEPRYMIILGGRSFGVDHVRHFVAKRLYIGNEISASELIG